MSLYLQALEYHRTGRKGKIEVVSTFPLLTERDLDIAAGHGASGVCREISQNEELSFEHTCRGNLVAIVSNGTAVLGLGNIGALASKPVMEGKAILFKKFAGIDAFDIELSAPNPADVIRMCEMLEPTFGGINLEDIKAPECFEIEETLRSRLRIPVFHDDQHGTAIICGAALLNALEVARKKIDEIRCVFIGGGAACIASARMFLQLGVRPEHLTMTDLDGVIFSGRTRGMNPYKEAFARKTDSRTLSEALVDADVLVGLSAKGAVEPEMLTRMARDPLIFTLANPDPEISPEEVVRARPDAIIATGRSDYPNQVNNVLGFPSLFRGALDTRATSINEDMKMAAVRSLALLARQTVPEEVSAAYGGQSFRFGREYLIPKPFDPRVLQWVAPAVAKAAMDSGVARIRLDPTEYGARLEELSGGAHALIRGMCSASRRTRLQDRLPRIAIPMKGNELLFRACQRIVDESIAQPVLVGDPIEIQEMGRSLEASARFWNTVEIVDPDDPDRHAQWIRYLVSRGERHGMTDMAAENLLHQVGFLAATLVSSRVADGLLMDSGHQYTEGLRTVLQVIGRKSGSTVCGTKMVLRHGRPLWLADVAINIEPSPDDLCQIAFETARFAKSMMVDVPRIAFLSFSNFGSNTQPPARRVKAGCDLFRTRYPDYVADGEMQVDAALSPEVWKEEVSFSRIAGDANILIFPDLQSGSLCSHLISSLGTGEVLGPILLGMKFPTAVSTRQMRLEDIVSLTALLARECAHSWPETNCE